MTDNEIIDLILADLKEHPTRNLITDILKPRQLWPFDNVQRISNIITSLNDKNIISILGGSKYFPGTDMMLKINGLGIDIINEFDSYSNFLKYHIEKEKMERLKGAKIEINLKGHGNLINLGSIINSTIKNTIKLKEDGNDAVAKAIDNLTNAINDANDINDEDKEKFLEQLKFLSDQALIDKENRISLSVLEPIIKYGLGSLNAIGSVASIWGLWGEVIKNFFWFK